MMMINNNFLYVQRIVIKYYKDVRYSNFAQQRQAIKFCPIEISQEESLSEIFFSRAEVFQDKDGIKKYLLKNKILTAEKAVYNPDEFYSKPFGEKIALQKSGDDYIILYKKGGFYKKCFLLEISQYARIVYNRRIAGFDDCVDRYYDIIFNFLHSDKPICSPGLFYRKKPDYEYKDLNCLYR